MRSTAPAARRTQRGYLGTLVLTPIIVAMVSAPLVAARHAQIAEQKRLDHEVRQLLAPKGKRIPVPPDLAADARLEAEVEVQGNFRF